jgi:ketosteroid isomerase-like protein
MKLILAVLIVVIFISSCNQPSPQAGISKAPVDSLILEWENSWNKHDSAGVRNSFLPDALLIDDNLIATGSEELSDKWIHPNITVVNNLKTTRLQDWSTNDRAGYTGKYELDVVVNDSVIAKPTGIFTVNWVKTDKGDWKINTAAIHSFSEQK